MAIGHDQQTGIIGQQRAPAAALFGAPADEVVTIFEVKGGCTPSGHSQPLALVDERLAQMLANQGDVVEVMVCDDRLVAPADVVRGIQQSEVAMLQNLEFVSGNVAAFLLAHSISVKKDCKDVPNKVLTYSQPGLPRGEKPRPTDLQTECPGVGLDLIRHLLDRPRKEKKVECLGTGRSARWQKPGN
jgi:hypothetical protein